MKPARHDVPGAERLAIVDDGGRQRILVWDE